MTVVQGVRYKPYRTFFLQREKRAQVADPSSHLLLRIRRQVVGPLLAAVGRLQDEYVAVTLGLDVVEDLFAIVEVYASLAFRQLLAVEILELSGTHSRQNVRRMHVR